MGWTQGVCRVGGLIRVGSYSDVNGNSSTMSLIKSLSIWNDKIRSLFCCYLILFCSSCCERDVIYKAISPDHSYETVVIRENCGATVPYVFMIYISNINSLSLSSPVFVGYGVESIKADWDGSNSLIIYHHNGTVKHISSKWISLNSDRYMDSVAISAVDNGPW